MSFQFTPSECRVRKVERVEFGILSPEEIKRYSVVKIEHVDLYENKEPKVGGLSDVRMGCIDRNMTCYTCHENMNSCPGHFGHIELTIPVYHVEFLKVVKKILECVCHKCARFRLLPTDHRFKKLLHVKDKFEYACENAKNKLVCEYADCESQLLPIRRQGVTLYFDPRKIDKKMARIPLSAAEARNILERISDDTCRLIGLNPEQARPEWMILTVLAVPPPCVRPSISMDSVNQSQDDLTHVLIDIVKYNNLVKRYENSRSAAEFKQHLQNHVTNFINNDVKGVPPSLQKGGRPVKSVTARLKGKEGLIRGHLMGKRVNFSSRTVITGDPNISIEEVGVPYTIARNLTFPERVTPYNIEYLQTLVNNSPKYPGAKFVIREDDSRVDLQLSKIKPTIKIGDVVERHMRDNDLVIFNRQPTLHKMSMMCHRVRVLPYSTFRLNVNVCSSYNADFDGDEMNLHMPQSYQALAELQTLSRVSTLLVSPQANKPVNALVQDALRGIRALTRRDTFIDREEMMNLLMWVKPLTGETFPSLPTPAILKPQPLWTGKQLLSTMLPRIDLKGYHSIHSNKKDEWKQSLGRTPTKEEARQWELLTPWDTRVLIDDGELLTGTICKKTAGASAGSMTHIIWQDYGPEAARDFLDNSSQVIVQWMMSKGSSVGLGDGILPDFAKKQIKDTIDKQYKEADMVLKMYTEGTLVPQGNMTVEETKEVKMQDILAKARDLSGKIANKVLPHFNNIKEMAEAGSKGTVLNICQISASVGQQIVEGQRIPNRFKDRTLPHFHKWDDSPGARGFVRNAFMDKLEPHELFFHAMGGREGLIDTACRTAETGYIQRRLIKAFEDLTVKYDGTVRDSHNTILQFQYGEDGFDGTAIESQIFETMLLSDADFEKYYKVPELPQEWKQLCKDRRYLRDNLRLQDDRWQLPLNLKRMITRSMKLHPSGEKPSYQQVYQEVSRLRKTLRCSRLNMGVPGYNPSLLFFILLSSTLSSKQIVDRWKLSRQAFEWLISQLEEKYRRGLIQPGECVGILAAQSIGEPATQMTLNVFHLSGTGNKAVTSGIPRLKELINAVKNLKTPGMTVYLNENIRLDAMAARKIKAKIEHCPLVSIVNEISVYYDVNYQNSVIEKDLPWLTIVNDIPDPDAPTPDLLHPWVLRLLLSREVMLEKDISMRDVEEKISECFGQNVYILHSDDNDPELVLHIRLFKDEQEIQEERENLEPPEDSMTSGEFLESIKMDILHSLTVKGVPGIDKAFISQKQIVEYDETGALNASRKEFIIETDGINMRDVMKIKGVDMSRLYCNDPQEMLSVFGIEVARETLMEEVRSVIEGGASYINYRHLCLLCEVMTNRGQIMSITRHGMNKSDAGPLAKCTFEQTVDILMDAAVYGRVDNIKGVAENIIMGQIAKVGTGMMSMLLDEDAINKYSIEPVEERDADVDKGKLARIEDEYYEEYGMDADTFGDFFRVKTKTPEENEENIGHSLHEYKEYKEYEGYDDEYDVYPDSEHNMYMEPDIVER